MCVCVVCARAIFLVCRPFDKNVYVTQRRPNRPGQGALSSRTSDRYGTVYRPTTRLGCRWLVRVFISFPLLRPSTGETCPETFWKRNLDYSRSQFLRSYSPACALRFSYEIMRVSVYANRFCRRDSRSLVCTSTNFSYRIIPEHIPWLIDVNETFRVLPLQRPCEMAGRRELK